MTLKLFLIFFIISAFGCIGGFINFVHFMSVGYGFSVAALGIAYGITAFILKLPVNWVSLILCLLLVCYGLRLALFLLFREKNASYKASLAETKPFPFFVKAAMWVCVAIMYILQTSGVFFRLYNNKGNEIVLPLAGSIIAATGFVIEALADKQKSAQKIHNPRMVATKGLFKLVRCPNYLGEILFWTGITLSSLNCLSGSLQWIFVIAGYILIVFVMINGAERLDKKQEKRYGSNPDYRAYADNTPIIIPFIPVCHIGDYKGEKAKDKATS